MVHPPKNQIMQGLIVGSVCSGLMLPVLLIVYYFMSYHDHLYKFEVIFVVVVGSILLIFA